MYEKLLLGITMKIFFSGSFACRGLDSVLQAYEYAAQNGTPKTSSMLNQRLMAGPGTLDSCNVTQISVCGKVKQYLLLEHNA